MRKVTEYPCDFSNRPMEAEAMPLPRDEITPPVTKRNRVLSRRLEVGGEGRLNRLAPGPERPPCGA